MKSTMLILLAGCFLVIAPVSGQAQMTGSEMLGRIRTINSDAKAVKAVRDFWKRYGEGANEKWYQAGDGMLAEFASDGIKNNVMYDSRGVWVYTIRIYTEKELPGDVRALVKHTYFDYTIGWVREIDQPDWVWADEAPKGKVYLIHVEDADRWKTIRICEEEMSVAESFEKKP